MSNGLGAFRVEPANALKPERSLSSHNYRLSAYERKEKDFYPTPGELGTGLALGLRRLGLYSVLLLGLRVSCVFEVCGAFGGRVGVHLAAMRDDRFVDVEEEPRQ
jgi:hypothetical protein